jgi:hypothetical protein
MTLSTSTITLAPGQSRTYNLAPGEAVTVNCDPNVICTVTETPDVIATADQAGQTNNRVSNLQYRGNYTYGPYMFGGTVAVAVSARSTSSVSVTLLSSVVAIFGAVMSNQSYTSLLSMIGEDQMDIVPSYTSLPLAAQNYRRTYWVTDQKAGYLSDGTNWLPLSERVLHDLGAETPPTMSGTVETILDQFIIPAGCWRDTQDLMIMITSQKSGTTENFTGRLRIGTLGTLSDTLVIGGTLLGGTSDGTGFFLPIKRLSATSVFKYGSGSFSGSMGGGSTTDVAAAVTVNNLDSNAVTVTLSALSSSTVETVTLYNFRATLSQ